MVQLFVLGLDTNFPDGGGGGGLVICQMNLWDAPAKRVTVQLLWKGQVWVELQNPQGAGRRLHEPQDEGGISREE